jgi:hypothetical protein
MKQHSSHRIILLFLFAITEIFSQKISVTGKVFDSVTNKGLPFANIRIENNNTGTAANKEGYFRLNVGKGSYNIIASYVGYVSDTLDIKVNENSEINFSLEPGSVKIPEVIVSANDDFISEIIRKAIETKNRNREKIKTYKYSAYTKGIIRTTKDFQQGGIGISGKDDGKLKITGVLENESRGFYKAPDKIKFFIVARKQTENIPPFINAMTGAAEIQSFYEEDVEFLGRYIPTPIAERALKYYDFNLEKEILTNGKKIYQINFKVKNPSTIGFYGTLFIADSSFALLKVDAFLNHSANPGGIFKFVKIFQQFSFFKNDIILPVDYHLSAEGNYLGLAKFGFELHSVMYNYEINKPVEENIFDSAILTVLPDADKKDDAYWKNIKTIPGTSEELKAYNRIKNLSGEAKISNTDLLLSTRIKLNDNFSVTGPLSIYNFSKVEGSNVGLDLYYEDVNGKRLKSNLGFNYGFADKKLKKEINVTYLLGNYRTTSLTFNAYDKLAVLFKNSDRYNKFTSTFLSLFTKYDFRDYYYTKGFKFNAAGDVLPFLNLGIGFVNRTDETAKNNSDFSFFYRSRKYSENIPVYDTKTNALTASFKLDFRKFIEDGFFRKRISKPNAIFFEGGIFLSNKDYLKSENDFQIYSVETYGRFLTFRSASLMFDVKNIFSSGAVPFQMMYALSGNINIAGKNNSFRTLRIGEMFGDKVTEIFLTHNFNDELFKLLNIPYLKKSHIQLKTYLNIAWSDISEESKSILPVNYKTFKKPFYELGFSIGHILFPMTLEFTWKLNYRGYNNFVFGVNTFVL